MPFVYEMDYTYETKGAKRVAINQLGRALSKRQCTAQVCFRPEPPPPPPASASDEVKRRYRENLLEQPPPCIIFLGTGKGISQYERDAYPRELMVLWQPKAWCDRPIALEWAKLVFKKVIDADSAAGVCESEDSYVLPAHPGQPRRAEAARVPRRAQEASNRRPRDHEVPPNNTDGTHVCVNVNEWKSVQTPDIDKSEL